MGITGKDRCFLLLQGPHGPFFWQLGRLLRAAGARVWRVGFTFGDRAMWPGRAGYIGWRGDPADWPAACADLMEARGITDLVIYGDTRAVHAQAVAAARRMGITVHCFEEGYLRPHWVTYERGGVNGHSRLMQTGLAEMTAALARLDMDLPDAPARWGDMRQHIFYGALYHALVLAGLPWFRTHRTHREIGLWQEFGLYLRHIALLPQHRLARALTARRIATGGFPFHLVLLQLEHDASFRAHSPFATMTEFLALVLDAFARGAAPHHHLVFKAHPLEDGRAPIARAIRALARQHGVADRVHFLRGGRLAPLLDQARSAVTVNSTAAQQVLWRGLPLKALGRAVYAKPEFVSDQPLTDFFARPDRPDSRAYRAYRHYLLETSQVAGGFYSARGRRRLLRQVVDMMLADHDPYDALTLGNAAPRQQLRLVT
jgi:capsular polysaccharide export protein